MYIQRKNTTELIELINQFPVVGIIGPRQVGKTTLARHLMNQIDKVCIYLDLELPEDQSKLSDPQLYLEHHLDKCVILDEIQQIPDIFPVLRALIDKHRVAGRYVILGSASPALLKQSSETLAGRIVYKELSPFNLTESDLVLVRGSKPLSCIEIKYTAAPKLSKGLQIAIEDLGTEANFIIVPQSETYPVGKNVKVCSLLDFLTKHVYSEIGIGAVFPTEKLKKD